MQLTQSPRLVRLPKQVVVHWTPLSLQVQIESELVEVGSCAGHLLSRVHIRTKMCVRQAEARHM